MEWELRIEVFEEDPRFTSYELACKCMSKSDLDAGHRRAVDLSL